MRNATLVVILLVSIPAWADTVQLSKSTYHEQHITVEDKGDHYLLHCNVYFKLDQPPEDGALRFLHVSAAFSRDETLSDVSREKRSVQIKQQEEVWSFYFRVPKFRTNQASTLYAVVASVDGVQSEAAAVWRFDGNRLNLGSPDQPLAMYYPVGRTTTQDDGAGGFRLVVVYEVSTHVNNYEALPVCGFLKSDKKMPATIDGERSAKRL